MPDDRNILLEILQRVTKVETKMDDMTNAKEIAQEALQSTKAAHHRIDDLKNDDIKELKANQTWLWRTAITSIISAFIAVIGAVATFLSSHK